ncbi:hypothetical protein RCO28_36120 [Streptomyces sp. LHD-70]|uniref:hypothetical protein n=1 Tax=Streptomyces sp. LHD-70 TaxID=3072140 RepID=UPI00280D89EC|nr:hypothetical protein [Streptomyces sp. LHD-70]MDQ8707857.1 hypothetical protein [Streptomyces sp. LHD-70]
MSTAGVPPPTPRNRPSIDERFEAFHASHPWVLEVLEELVGEWVERGGGRISVKALFEQLRWSHFRRDIPQIRLNNVFTSRYARLLCREHPEWADAFELRRLRAERVGDRDSLTVKVVVK